MTRLPLRLAASALALALLAGAAQAQAPQPGTSHLAIAREVASLAGLVGVYDAVPVLLMERLRQQTVSRPELTKDLGEVLDGLKPEMELQKQQMVNTTARVLATRMSEADLKETATFFRSPVGRKYVEAQPQVLEDISKEMSTWSDQLAEYIMVRVRAEMGKRGHALQ